MLIWRVTTPHCDLICVSNFAPSVCLAVGCLYIHSSWKLQLEIIDHLIWTAAKWTVLLVNLHWAHLRSFSRINALGSSTADITFLSCMVKHLLFHFLYGYCPRQPISTGMLFSLFFDWLGVLYDLLLAIISTSISNVVAICYSRLVN